VRLLAMQRPAYNHIKRALSADDDSQALVFVSDRKQARLTALDFTTFINSEATRKEKERFLGQ
jgi:replicative superfamily II helicase